MATPGDAYARSQAKCEANKLCVAFMYGGSSYDPNPANRKNLCELAGTTIPDKGWGDNYRFCKAGTHVNKTGAWGAGGGDALCPSEHT